MKPSWLIRSRHSDRQAVLLHKGCSKKKKESWLLSSVSSPGQRTDGGRRKRERKRHAPPVPLLNRCMVYLLKINQTWARPPLFDLPQPYSALFPVPPTGPQLMATLCNV